MHRFFMATLEVAIWRRCDTAVCPSVWGDLPVSPLVNRFAAPPLIARPSAGRWRQGQEKNPPQVSVLTAARSDDLAAIWLYQNYKSLQVWNLVSLRKGKTRCWSEKFSWTPYWYYWWEGVYSCLNGETFNSKMAVLCVTKIAYLVHRSVIPWSNLRQDRRTDSSFLRFQQIKAIPPK
jgi:hypothetical protein